MGILSVHLECTLWTTTGDVSARHTVSNCRIFIALNYRIGSSTRDAESTCINLLTFGWLIECCVLGLGCVTSVGIFNFVSGDWKWWLINDLDSHLLFTLIKITSTTSYILNRQIFLNVFFVLGSVLFCFHLSSKKI